LAPCRDQRGGRIVDVKRHPGDGTTTTPSPHVGQTQALRRSHDPTETGAVARVSLPNQPVEWLPLRRRLDAVIELRQSNRRHFGDGAVEPGGRPGGERRPAHRAELRAWTNADPSRRDGVPATLVPHVDAGSGDDIPIRDFDTHGLGRLPTKTHSSLNQCVLLLGTSQDQPAAWLRAGEALERVLLLVWASTFRMVALIDNLTRLGRTPGRAPSRRRRPSNQLARPGEPGGAARGRKVRSVDAAGGMRMTFDSVGLWRNPSR
jgi:hypothetical protein